jgi:hypothetical protein
MNMFSFLGCHVFVCERVHVFERSHERSNHPPQVPDVRKYALELCKEMYRFLGKRVQDMVHENESIREAQKKELDAMFATLSTGTQSHDDDTHTHEPQQMHSSTILLVMHGGQHGTTNYCLFHTTYP